MPVHASCMWRRLRDWCLLHLFVYALQGICMCVWEVHAITHALHWRRQSWTSTPDTCAHMDVDMLMLMHAFMHARTHTCMHIQNAQPSTHVQSGAAIYANRIPERWRPGKHDYWLSSHQIFHGGWVRRC